MKDHEEFCPFFFLQPHCFLLAIKIEPKKSFEQRLLPLSFIFFCQDQVIVVDDVAGEDIMDAPVIIAVATCSSCSLEVGMTMLIKLLT